MTTFVVFFLLVTDALAQTTSDASEVTIDWSWKPFASTGTHMSLDAAGSHFTSTDIVCPQSCALTLLSEHCALHSPYYRRGAQTFTDSVSISCQMRGPTDLVATGNRYQHIPTQLRHWMHYQHIRRVQHTRLNISGPSVRIVRHNVGLSLGGVLVVHSAGRRCAVLRHERSLQRRG